MDPAQLTLSGIRAQLTAMDCELYDIALLKHGETKAEDRFFEYGIFTPSELLSLNLVRKLRRENALHNSVYIQPHATENRLLLVDDLDGVMLEEMKSAKVEPCCVLLTSPKNHQAWIKFDAPLTGLQRKIITGEFAKLFGSDAGCIGARHYGRLAGFVNYKPEHCNIYDLAHPYPWVLCVNYNGRVCTDAGKIRQWSIGREKEQLELEARQSQFQPLPADNEIRMINGIPLPTAPRIDATEYYCRTRSQWLAKQAREGIPPDFSTGDYFIASAMIESGYSHNEVVNAMLEGRPDILEKKHGPRGALAYAERTYESAKKRIGQCAQCQPN